MPPSQPSAPGGAASDRLARRYGRTTPAGPARGRSVWIGAAVVAVFVLAVVVWMRSVESTPIATVTAATYEVVSDSKVTVTFAVLRPDPSVAVECTVEATDASGAQVGAALVEVPPGSETSTPVRSTLTTFARAEAASAIENGCFAVDGA